MDNEEFVLFITRESISFDEGGYRVSYRLARLVDVQDFHIELIEEKLMMGTMSEHDEAFGFLFADIDEVNADEDVERGRLEAKRIFISITEEFPTKFLNGNETHVISKAYEITVD